MKQQKHSDTTFKSNLESSASSDSAQKNYQMAALPWKIIKITLSIFSVAILITIYFLANRINRTKGIDVEYVPAVNSQSLEVEVLDGAGSMKAAQQMTNLLRLQGYDVVEMKKNNGEVEERTFVLDRSGNLEAAKKLASILGVSQDKVFQKIDRNLYLDITVVLGKDYTRLKAFQLSIERKVN